MSVLSAEELNIGVRVSKQTLKLIVHKRSQVRGYTYFAFFKQDKLNAKVQEFLQSLNIFLAADYFLHQKTRHFFFK